MSKLDKAAMMSFWIMRAANSGCTPEEFTAGCELLENDWEYYSRLGFVSLTNAAHTKVYGAKVFKQEQHVTRV